MSNNDSSNLKDKQDLYSDKLSDDKEIYSKKDEILKIVNSCLHFISEFKVKKYNNQDFGVKKTKFYDSLIQLRDELQKTINVEKMREYIELLEKYGIKILNQTQQDKSFFKYINIIIFTKRIS